MSRCKNNDLEVVAGFLRALEQFQKLKKEKWEKVDDGVQANNRLGSPTEDWIIPPDEDKTLAILDRDTIYPHLKKEILDRLKEVKKITSFLRTDLHHSLDWVNFNSPLIGNAALEEAIAYCKELEGVCHRAAYFPLNLRQLIFFWRAR